ncbi:MAG: hypothetical protein ACLQUT_04610 [Thermoleophilia bacterium]
MKRLFILLLIIALALLTLGVVNHGVTFNLDYVFGTWHHVLLLWVFLIAIGLVVAVGLLASSYSAMRSIRRRHKLERELQETYKRLRAAEAQVAAQTAASAAEVTAARVVTGEEATIAGAAPAASAATTRVQTVVAPAVAAPAVAPPVKPS